MNDDDDLQPEDEEIAAQEAELDELGEDDPDDDALADPADDDLGDDELDEDALGDDDELGEDDLGDEDLDDDAVLTDEAAATEDEGSTIVARPGVPDEEEEDDDEVDPDDVEASLDDILKDRLVIEEVEVDDEEDAEVDDRNEGSSVVPPKRPDEFVCQSCFLVKHPSQLADAARILCRDCV